MFNKKQKNFKSTEKTTLDQDVFSDSNKETVKKELVSYMDDSDDSELVPEKVKRKTRLCRQAFWLSVFSGIVTLAFSLASFFISSDTASSSIFANAFDAFLGTISSVAVAWRFRDQLNGGVVTIQRERIATFGIGLSFIATGIATIAASVVHLTETVHLHKPQELLIILWCSLAAFMSLAYVQYCLASKLNSQSMCAASADSAMAATMSFGIVTSTYIYRVWPKQLWWLDHAVACFLGTISAIYGIYLLSLMTICNEAILGGKRRQPDIVAEDKVPLKKY